jgi:hypothetical protein
MEMLNNAMAYFSPPSTPRKSVMQFFENLNPLNSFKSDSDNHMSSQEASISGHDKSSETKAAKSHHTKNPTTPKNAAAAFNFSNNTIVPSNSSSVFPTTLSPAAIVLEKPPAGRTSRPLSTYMGKKKPPPPPPCDPSTSILPDSSPKSPLQEIDPEVLAGALAKAGLVAEEDKDDAIEEEIEEFPALFPPRPPKPGYLSRSSSLKPVSQIPSITPPPPIPPKTYKKSYGYSS